MALPDENGHFNNFGGRYVPETLMPALLELEERYRELKDSKAFKEKLTYYLSKYVGRETPLYYAERLSKHIGRGKIYLKREDLCHTGSHKLNNTLGQALIAVDMGKKRLIAETGAGQHGVATATLAAAFGLDCEVYMGEEDVRRQSLNVFRMKLLGAKVNTVTSGTRTLKDATSEAIRDWVTNVEDTYYVIGSVVGPHPYPMLVRDFQSVIGNETKKQFMEVEGTLPDYLVACVGGGSNSMGMFYPFLEDESVRMLGVEAGGEGIETGRHSASISGGRPGVLHGMQSFLLQDSWGQILPTHSIAAGLDYPGIGPEHSYFKKIGRANYTSVNDMEATSAFRALCELEGIIPALESAHAVAQVIKMAPSLREDDKVVICLSGRGDKDAMEIKDILGENN